MLKRDSGKARKEDSVKKRSLPMYVEQVRETLHLAIKESKGSR